jgi:glycosyltransferase involved in cell wall biosynthesis
MKKKNILMIVENFFPADSRVRKEASILKQHYAVSVIALRKKQKSERFYEKHEDISIYRIPELPEFNMGKVRYMMEYLYFTLSAAMIFACTYPFKRYQVIHVHNPPDVLFSVGLLGKAVSAKFVYDHHDLSPELYLTRFSGRKDLIYKALILSEKISCRLADAVISTNESYKKIETGRHQINEAKVFVVRNNPVLDDCRPPESMVRPAAVNGGKKVLLFLGSINPQDGVDVLLQAVRILVYEKSRTDFLCRIVGDGDALAQLRRLASDLGVAPYVEFTGMVLDRSRVRQYLASCDVGVEPAPQNALNNHSTFIKIMEYMASRKPIVAFDLAETRYSADGAAMLVPPNDIRAFAAAIATLLDDPQMRERLGKAGFERIEKEMQWEHASVNLMKAYQTLSL